MRISKRTREDAALILSIAASDEAVLYVASLYRIAYQIDASRDACDLACAARDEAAHKLWPMYEPVLMHAEAEAMVRTGWSPRRN